MRLRGIKLAGFLGFHPSFGGEISNVDHRTFLIGPNNSGKSSIIKFMQLLKTIQRKDPDSILFPNEYWWQHDTGKTISAELSIEVQGELKATIDNIPNSLGSTGARFISLLHNNILTISIQIKLESSPKIKIFPFVWVSGIRKTIRYFDANGKLDETNAFDPTDRDDYQKLIQPSQDIYHKIISKCLFFDPIRSLGRSSNSDLVNDGSKLLGELFKWSKNSTEAPKYRRFENEYITLINQVLSSSGMSEIHDFKPVEIPTTNLPSLSIAFKSAPQIPFDIYNMGTGISQLFILLASFIKNKDQYIYFIEEPEVHLHPALVRRLSQSLKSMTSSQFIISSHSSAILESLTSNDRIYRFSVSEIVGNSILEVSDARHKQQLLDDLGMNGSTLFQANCVIWVEGPSDRIYLNCWLKGLDASLIEGVDYSIAFYGGRVLSHFSLDTADDNENTLIELMKINRYSAVLMDSDVSSIVERVNLTKQRILDEAASSQNTCALLTRGREIENDLPIQFLRSAIANLTNIEESVLCSLEFTNTRNYFDEAADFVSGRTSMDRESLCKLFKNKMKIAKCVENIFHTQNTQPPVYIQNHLLEFIRKSSRLI